MQLPLYFEKSFTTQDHDNFLLNIVMGFFKELKRFLGIKRRRGKAFQVLGGSRCEVVVEGGDRYTGQWGLN